MEVIRYLCWRLSPAGRACYRSYALTMDPQRTLTSAPVRRASARPAGYAAERPQRVRRPARTR